MPPVKYQIYELSARSVLGYAREQDGEYSFTLDAAETKKCVSLALEQDDKALFYQIMCVLHGDDLIIQKNHRVISDLSGIIFYMDFGGIFDHRTGRKKYLTRQKPCSGPMASPWILAAVLTLMSPLNAPEA